MPHCDTAEVAAPATTKVSVGLYGIVAVGT